MARTVASFCLAAIGTVVVGTPGAAAQGVRYGLGGGLAVPIIDYADIDKTGWGVGADATYWLSSGRIGIRAQASFNQTRQRAGACCLSDHTTQIAGGGADVVYAFGVPARSTRLYLLAGIGLYNVRLSAPGFTSSSDTRVGFGGGAGVGYGARAGSLGLFLEAQVTSVTVNGVNFATIPVRVGLRTGSKQASP